MLILAHRGAHAPETACRENTLAAFAAALDIGADGVELDARLTRDGVLVVHHDPEVEGRAIATIDAAERPEWLPTLSAALAACPPPALVNVEIKAGRAEDPGIAARLADLLNDAPNIVVSSFNLAVLDAFHALAPAVPTAWLTLPGYDPTSAVDTAVAAGHRGINPHDGAVTPELVELAHRAGLQVAVWTVDEPARMGALEQMGVDILITDRPLVARQTLR